MGQCSSNCKQQRSKKETEEQFDSPAVDLLETLDDIVAPELSGLRHQRRAIDEYSGRRDLSAVGRDRAEDFGLTALRSSLDDNTCTALLALRMGRGSSVGGMLNTTGSGANTENGMIKTGAKAMDRGQQKRPSGFSEATRASMDSNDRLNVLLASGGTSDAARPPQIPSQA